MAKQIVMLKGTKNGIHIILDESADFGEIKASLRSKVIAGAAFFEGAASNIAFKGRGLTEAEEQDLLDIILEETSMEMNFVESVHFIAPRREDENMPTEGPVTLPYTESPTAYFGGGLRNGQSVKHSGSVVIMGDANAGSEIIAGGNVIVLGALKGMAHAGNRGDDACFISALSLTPTQLRIGKIITYVPTRTGEKPGPATAYVKDGEVFIVAI